MEVISNGYGSKVINYRDGHIEIRHDLCPIKQSHVLHMVDRYEKRWFTVKTTNYTFKIWIKHIYTHRRQYQEYLNFTVDGIIVVGEIGYIDAKYLIEKHFTRIAKHYYNLPEVRVRQYDNVEFKKKPL